MGQVLAPITSRRSLLVAASFCRLQEIRVLLEEGNANPNIRDGIGRTPLHLLCLGYLNVVWQYVRLTKKVTADGVEAARLLLEKGANPNLQDDKGNTPLHLLCCGVVTTAGLQMAALLIEYGANLTYCNTEGRTPLDIISASIVTKNRALLAETLLAGKANPSLPNKEGSTPLHRACSGTLSTNSHRLVNLLLQHGADPNVRDNANRSPLLLICDRPASDQCCRIVGQLLDYGADPNVTLSDGSSLLTEICRQPMTKDAARIILDLLQYGVKVQSRNSANLSALFVILQDPDARFTDYEEVIVKAFLEKGCDPNFKDLNDTTPLHLVCRSQNLTPHNINIAEMLLKEGANVNSRDFRSRTPLHLLLATKYAVVPAEQSELRQRMCYLFLLNEASEQCRDGCKLTPMLNAIINNFWKCAYILLLAGAEFSPVYRKMIRNAEALSPVLGAKNVEDLNWLINKLQSVMTLKELSRISLRRAAKQEGVSLNQLLVNLPTSLQSYVKFENVELI